MSPPRGRDTGREAGGRPGDAKDGPDWGTVATTTFSMSSPLARCRPWPRGARTPPGPFSLLARSCASCGVVSTANASTRYERGLEQMAARVPRLFHEQSVGVLSREDASPDQNCVYSPFRDARAPSCTRGPSGEIARDRWHHWAVLRFLYYLTPWRWRHPVRALVPWPVRRLRWAARMARRSRRQGRRGAAKSREVRRGAW